MSCPIHPNTFCVCHTQTATAAQPLSFGHPMAVGIAMKDWMPPGTAGPGLTNWLSGQPTIEPSAEQRRIQAIEAQVAALMVTDKAHGEEIEKLKEAIRGMEGFTRQLKRLPEKLEYLSTLVDMLKNRVM